MADHKAEFLQRLKSLGNPARVPGVAKFFQAYPGGYGEGDSFYAISVPDQRRVTKEFAKLLSLNEIAETLRHPVHEVRLTTLMLMVHRFERSKDAGEKEALVRIYTGNADYVNNWDLVDSSAHKILGAWLMDKPRDLLYEWALTDHLWKQRISIIATHWFIRNRQFEDTFRIAEILLNHRHDLIHKGVGWMLREAGNLDYEAEYAFLAKHYKTMPRTMLRYAIEKFEEPVRQGFLKGTI
jgi:3-methyladenine DNA glycosylase AlkD